MGNDHSAKINDLESKARQMRNDAKEREEALEVWTREQTEAREEREREACEEREREAREQQLKDDRHKRELEKLANQLKQMDIDRKNNEDIQARAEEIRIRKEKEEEIRIIEERMRKEKEEKIRIREEKERQEKLRAEIEKKRVQNIAELRTEIKKIKPGGSFEFPDDDIIFPKRLNIGLYGATGIGKTSLMNSVKFAVKGELKETHREQAAPDDFEGGHTTRRMAVRVTPYLTFVDNRGIGAEDIVKEGAADELIIQLEGKRSFASEVEWGKSSCPDDLEVDETKKIYCTVLVFSARSVTAVHTIIGKFVERLLKWQGRFPLAVITHVDVATPEQLDNMRLALRMAGIVDVYEVANITNEKKDLEPVYQENLLKLLHKCVKDGDRIFELRHEIELEEKKGETKKNKLAN